MVYEMLLLSSQSESIFCSFSAFTLKFKLLKHIKSLFSINQELVYSISASLDFLFPLICIFPIHSVSLSSLLLVVAFLVVHQRLALVSGVRFWRKQESGPSCRAAWPHHSHVDTLSLRRLSVIPAPPDKFTNQYFTSRLHLWNHKPVGNQTAILPVSLQPSPTSAFVGKKPELNLNENTSPSLSRAFGNLWTSYPLFTLLEEWTALPGLLSSVLQNL